MVFPRTFLIAMTGLMATVGPAYAELVQKPALSVSANDGRLANYSAAIPLDLSSNSESTLLTARVAGDVTNPTYNIDLNLTQKADPDTVAGRSMALGASWNDREAAVRSSMSKAFGFGFLPRANYVSLSMDMNAVQPTYIRGRAPVAQANLRSSLTLDGRPIGSIAFGGGSLGQEAVDFSVTRPFDIPAELTFSVRTEDERIADGRVMLKLVTKTW
jgi:hypothetical protein